MDKLTYVEEKKQFKWNGGSRELKQFLDMELNIDAKVIGMNDNGTCIIYKLPNVTINLYSKSKTVQVQGKKEMTETFEKQILLKIDNPSSSVQRTENDDDEKDQDGSTSKNEESEDDTPL